MDKNQILQSLGKKSNGEIYFGVVGSVRTGKSTFIKKCIELLVLPNIEDEMDKKRFIDEIPQSASGKTIMTIEPKFVPSNGANINVNGINANIKFVDCVGFIIPGSIGYEDTEGNPRMVKTPWFNEELPFVEAAEIGTQKVIQDHATIGIVITTDGTILDMPRSNYIDAEDKVINELKNINKPFIMVLNSKNPTNIETKALAKSLKEKYNIPVIPMNVDKMTEEDITEILQEALYEFPVEYIEFKIPDWVGILKPTHPLKKKIIDKMKETTINIDKLRDVNTLNVEIEDEDITKSYISSLDTDNSLVTITLETKEELFDDILKEIVGEKITSKGELLKMFQDFSEGRNEYSSLKGALKQVSQTGYGIVLPKISDMKLEKPQIIKQAGRFGIKLQAKASSIHMIKVDVESSFEPIIGSESQSKELIEHIMSFEHDPDKLWNSELFGRSLNDIVSEGIQAKLSLLPDNTKYKLSQTITKMVNKGSNNLIAIVL